MAIFLREAGQIFRRGTAVPERDRALDLKPRDVESRRHRDADGAEAELPLDDTHAPAVRAFLADYQEGMTGRQAALARAVLLARLVC